MSLSVAIITKNEEANIRRTLESVKWADEIVVVDSGSTDRTCEIAREYGAKVFVEEWKGFAKQKNSTIDKCTGDWILSLDADEEVSAELASEIPQTLNSLDKWNQSDPSMSEWEDFRTKHPDQNLITLGKALQLGFDENVEGFPLRRRNMFLSRWIRYGGFYPDAKVRLFLRAKGRFQERAVHEVVKVAGEVSPLEHDLIHHAYPTLSGYIEHMNRYSDLGAEMVVDKKGKVGFSLINIVLRPLATFVYNYFLRLGFLDGKEGLLLHLYHSVYVSWKYAKAWEASKKAKVQS